MSVYLVAFMISVSMTIWVAPRQEPLPLTCTFTGCLGLPRNHDGWPTLAIAGLSVTFKLNGAFVAEDHIVKFEVISFQPFSSLFSLFDLCTASCLHPKWFRACLMVLIETWISGYLLLNRTNRGELVVFRHYSVSVHVHNDSGIV